MADDTTTLSDCIYPLFLDALRGLASAAGADPLAPEADVLARLHEAACDAYARALESLDAELCASLPAGARVRDLRRRTIATRFGDVTFRRRACADACGNPLVPLDDAIDLPERARISPALEAELVWLAASDSYQRAADAAAYTGSSRVSRTAVMGCMRRAGDACRSDDERRAESLFADGVAPEGELAADVLCVESDGTVVRLQREGGDRLCEVKAMVAYAGKAARPGAGRVERMRPVSFGMVGTAGEMWAQGVAAVGSVYDLSKVSTVHTGFDGAGWCEGGARWLGFAGEVVGHLDPFHVNRAVARCFDGGAPDDRLEALALAYDGDAEGCAELLERMAADGRARPSVVAAVAPYLRRHASSIGVPGPSLGTMEPENQHVYKSRMASVPCAWTRRGASDMARIRSRIASGREVLRLTREQRVSEAASRRRLARVEAALSHGPSAADVVQSEGRGYEYPVQASTSGMRADVQYESGLRSDLRLASPR